MKNKRNLNINWLLLQNDQNADTTLLHSHDDFIFHQMKIFVPLHEWENINYLFYITCTKIQILKQI